MLSVVKVVPEVRALFCRLLVRLVCLQLLEERLNVLGCFDLLADVVHKPFECVLDDLLFVRDPFRGRPTKQFRSGGVILVAFYEWKRIAVFVVKNQ